MMSESLKLKVTEALSKDVGRGFARIVPKDLKTLQVALGDIVAVMGKKQTIAKVMPAYKELRGQSCVQLDGMTRENAGVGLDEFVQVHKITAQPAEHLVLAPMNITPAQLLRRIFAQGSTSTRPSLYWILSSVTLLNLVAFGFSGQSDGSRCEA